jgi:hypothetical protein
MNNIIENRKKVYQNLPKNHLSLNDLVLLYDINENDYNDLIDSVKNYIIKSLNLAYNKEFIWSDTFLEDNNDLILNLPNKTPNGVIKPKKEIEDQYTQIQYNINKILTNIGLYSHIGQMVLPNIRYKNSNENTDTKSRPYYTSKFHSDAWIGHKGDCQILIGVLGDVDNNTVEFNEPINVHDNYLDKAESFDEGNTRYEQFNILGTLTKGKLGIMDHACLHRTLIKENGKSRISVDIATMINSEYSHIYDKGYDPNMYTYHSSESIQTIGKTHKYTINESLNSLSTTVNIVKNV